MAVIVPEVIAGTPSGLRNRVFRKDLLDLFGRLLHGRLRRHAAVDDVLCGSGRFRA
jgi:hypothetical protein